MLEPAGGFDYAPDAVVRKLSVEAEEQWVQDVRCDLLEIRDGYCFRRVGSLSESLMRPEHHSRGPQ
jgi:hypothetical protein